MTDNTAKKYDQSEFSESNFGIRNKEDMKHIFDVMRNKIYSNKILAVLREYSTNACDAHIESNQRELPIKVVLPTPHNRVLSIRDFGAGLSEEDIRNIYTMYGASTKRGSTELNGQLGFGCLLTGQPIVTSTGVKNIEDLKIGDLVLTHRGRFRPVTDVMSRPYKGTGYEIHLAQGGDPFILTEEHPVFIRDNTGKLSWIHAKHIKDGRPGRTLGIDNWNSYASIPVVKEVVFTKLNIMNYLSDNYEIIDNNLVHTTYVDYRRVTDSKNVTYTKEFIWENFQTELDLSYELGWTLGLWAAEGSAGLKALNLTLNILETDLADRFAKNMKEFFNLDFKFYPREDRHSLELIATSVPVAELFNNICGRHAANKHIPDCIMRGTPESRRGFLDGVLVGDGSSTRSRFTVGLASRDLCWNIRTLMAEDNQFKQVEYLNYTNPNGTLSDRWSVDCNHNPKWRMNFTEEGTVFKPILKTEAIDLDTIVYNVSVKEDESYVSNFTVHNSKAAFSYVDNYMIICYHEGTKTVYEAYVDETGLGAISQVSKEPSTEPTGIEIRVNVQLHDIASFKDTAAKLYKHFQITPLVENLGNITIDKPTYKLRGTTWGLRDQQGYSYSNENVAVMGNVAYPLNRQVLNDNLKQYSDWRKYEQLLGCPIDFFTPVGQLSIAASREALEYNKKTLRVFQELFSTTIKEITDEFARRISTAKDIVEAKQCYKLLMSGELKAVSSIITTGGTLRWNDQVIDDYRFEIPVLLHPEEPDELIQQEPAFTVKLLENPGRIGVQPKSSWLQSDRHHFEINDESKVFNQDCEDKPILRARKFFQDNPTVKKIYLFKPVHCTIDNITEAAEIPRKYFTNLSTQQPLLVENTREAGPHNAKHSRKVFRMAEDTSRGTGESAFWDTVTIDPDEEYFYVYLDRFCPRLTEAGRSTSNTALRDVLNSYQTLTSVNLRPRIIGVKIGHAERIAPTWRSLDAVLREGLAGQVQNAVASIENVALRNLRNNNPILNWLEAGNFQSHLSTIDNTSPMRRFFTRYRAATLEATNSRTNGIYDSLQNIGRQLNMTFPELDRLLTSTTTRIGNELIQVLDRYPLLRWVQVGYGQSASQLFSNYIADYIRSIDVQRAGT